MDAGRGHAPDAAASADQPVVIDLDATLVTSHSEKEQAAATFKRGYGFHPLRHYRDAAMSPVDSPLDERAGASLGAGLREVPHGSRVTEPGSPRRASDPGPVRRRSRRAARRSARNSAW